MSSSTHASPTSSSRRCERRLGRTHPRERLLGLGVAVVGLEPQRADQRRQREALDDERREHDGEGEEDDQVAARERRAGVGLRAGSSSAAAIVTAPRMPFHEMNAG